MAKKHPVSSTESEWIDPDDAPELTEEWFRKAHIYVGGKLVRRGERPTPDEIKEQALKPKTS